MAEQFLPDGLPMDGGHAEQRRIATICSSLSLRRSTIPKKDEQLSAMKEFVFQVLGFRVQDCGASTNVSLAELKIGNTCLFRTLVRLLYPFAKGERFNELVTQLITEDSQHEFNCFGEHARVFGSPMFYMYSFVVFSCVDGGIVELFVGTNYLKQSASCQRENLLFIWHTGNHYQALVRAEKFDYMTLEHFLSMVMENQSLTVTTTLLG